VVANYKTGALKKIYVNGASCTKLHSTMGYHGWFCVQTQPSSNDTELSCVEIKDYDDQVYNEVYVDSYFSMKHGDAWTRKERQRATVEEKEE
jgi:hypothetical protein